MKHIQPLGFILFLAIFNVAYASSKPEAFFNRYIELGESFDPSVASLYSDSAKIRAYRVYPHGLERSMELTGVQWKQLATKLMPMAKAQNDKSTYSKAVITKQGDGYKIKADRYSVRKCYTDTGYYMIVEPESNGKLLIVEEYIETQAQSGC